MTTHTTAGNFNETTDGATGSEEHAEARGARDEARGDRSSELGDRMKVARIGKIARLPRAVREELNHRLAEGVEGAELLAWLNGDARVIEVLAEKFGGRAITKQNLSAWRGGGYAEWGRHQRALEASAQMIEQLGDFEAMDVEGLADRMSAMAAVALGQALQRAMTAAAEGTEGAQAEVLEVVRQLVRLRASDQRAIKARRAEVEARRKLAVENGQRKEAEIAKVEAMKKDIQRNYDILNAKAEAMEEEGKAVPQKLRVWLAGEAKEMKQWANSVERVRAMEVSEFDPLVEEREAEEEGEADDGDLPTEHTEHTE